ncbi:MAG: hypothetical protein AAFQ98_00190 [Bacteroidota bacterium]
MAASEVALVSYHAIPALNPTYKYERLGQMALVRHQQYCDLHGYTFIVGKQVDDGCHACWQKIPALLEVLEEYPWVCWVDSDVLIGNMSIPLTEFIDPRYDLISQCPETFLRPLGWTKEQCYGQMLLNTGVFLIKNSAWSRDVLTQAYAKRQRVLADEPWDGLGEQEAMLEVIRDQQQGLARIGYHPHLQAHPKYGTPGDFGLHFYGNFAAHRIPNRESLAIIDRWEGRILEGGDLPADRARFHYASIQFKEFQPVNDRKNPEFFLYSEEEIEKVSRNSIHQPCPLP